MPAGRDFHFSSERMTELGAAPRRLAQESQRPAEAPARYGRGLLFSIFRYNRGKKHGAGKSH